MIIKKKTFNTSNTCKTVSTAVQLKRIYTIFEWYNNCLPTRFA